MKVYLKVKIKSLAAEATIIRKEENKAKASFRYLSNKTGKEDEYNFEKSKWHGLYTHRTVDVRNEARASQLAYAYIRGKPFSFVERNTNPYGEYGAVCSSLNPIIARVVKMVNKYGNQKKDVDFTTISKWIKETNSIAENKKNAA